MSAEPSPDRTCWKERFTHRRDAAKAAKRLGNAREYRCPECGDWHLTTKPKGWGRPHR